MLCCAEKKKHVKHSNKIITQVFLKKKTVVDSAKV